MKCRMSLSILLLSLLFCCSHFTKANPDCKKNPNDWYGVAYTIVVDQDGDTDFQTIQSAIDSIPENNDEWVHIVLLPDTYREKVTIPQNKPCIYIQGMDKAETVVEWDDHQQTDTSATFTSFPNNVLVKGITFKNLYNLEGNREIRQALSARIYGDKSAFYECGFLGVQATLWDATGRHYFKDCYIEGAIDFIFGYAQSIYEDCEINVNVGTHAREKPYGCITLQGRKSEDDPSGFFFKDCKITGTGQAYLGQPWEPYARVIMADSFLSHVIVPEGWDAGNFPGHEGSFTFVEYGNDGPGANTIRRVPWLKRFSASELHRFLDILFISPDGWIQDLPRVNDDLNAAFYTQKLKS